MALATLEKENHIDGVSIGYKTLELHTRLWRHVQLTQSLRAIQGSYGKKKKRLYMKFDHITQWDNSTSVYSDFNKSMSYKSSTAY